MEEIAMKRSRVEALHPFNPLLLQSFNAKP
jgi:hypothetical protein